jgi:hypothetical protein
MQISLDAVQKIAQIGFYVTLAVVTVLTFLRAKKGLLSNVNTEYHKKVIERLDELSKTLLDEYDFDSPNHWSKHGLVDDAVRAINEEFLASRDDIVREGKFEPGIRSNPDYERLSRLLQRIRSDPFIPEKIRDKAVDLLSNRADVIIEVHINELRKYCNQLAKGKYTGDLENTEGVIHNRVLAELNKRGCGIVQIEGEVHKLRLAIQEYFREFHP